MATVKRKGILNSKLAKLENAQKLGLLEAGMLVAQRATQKAPRDTGRLKRSIHPTVPQKVGAGKMITLVGTDVEYAIYQEFGTGDKSTRPQFSKDSSKPGIPPHPYLNPALKESKKDVKKLIKNAITKALQ